MTKLIFWNNLGDSGVDWTDLARTDQWTGTGPDRHTRTLLTNCQTTDS